LIHRPPEIGLTVVATLKFGWSIGPLSGLPLLLALACSSQAPAGDAAEPATGTDGGSTGDSACVPTETEYSATIEPILQKRCGQCHGTEPDRGAPFSLLEYPPLVEGEASRIVDRIVQRVSEGTMPPAGQPRLSQDEFDAVLSWASCGTADAAYTGGLEVSQPIFAAPSEPPPELRRIDLTAQDNPIPVGTIDDYQNFFFENVVDEEMFIRRFDIKLDESRVVHHVTLHYLDGDQYLYAWAPGTGAVQFPDGGLRVGPSDGFRVEIHYNNYSPTDDYVDSTGISLFVGPPEGAEYGMSDACTFRISVPAMSEGTAIARYTATADLRILAGMPHMHEIGSEFHQVIEHLDGTTEPLIDLTGWSFETQFFYALPAEMKAGETTQITCQYMNDKDRTVNGGLGTTDEMCYDFMYVTPPGALPTCNPNGGL
jgi:mono/diheme cytochrome c family protein